jgi:hypothetical protein
MSVGRNSARLAALVNRISVYVRERGEVKLAELALASGYSSIEYFKRSVLPAVLQLNACVEFDRYAKIVRWVCDNEEPPASGAAAVAEVGA